VAGAIRTTSVDTMGRNTFTDHWAIWGTGGVPIFGELGQLLAGYRFNQKKDSREAEFKADHHFSARLYMGSNKKKAYAEYQVASVDNETEYFYKLGLEAKMRGAWLEASVGGQGSTKSSIKEQTANFSLKFDPTALLKK
jgi:hypothetical protein